MPGLLVWLRGPQGPKAEIWLDNIEVYRKRSADQILGMRELTEAERHEPLDRLRRKYPVPSDDEN
ncbi:hypothetical protein ABIB94_009401 [Bradyrhizobium sp. JR7.2]